MSNETIAEGKKRTVAYRCTSCGSIVIMKLEECPHCFKKTLKQIDTQPILTHDQTIPCHEDGTMTTKCPQCKARKRCRHRTLLSKKIKTQWECPYRIFYPI
jgi:rubrerythrin